MGICKIYEFLEEERLILLDSPLYFHFIPELNISSSKSKILLRLFPGKLTSLGLYTPEAIKTASCFSFKSSNDLLHENKMGGLINVGKGSEHKPCMVIWELNGKAKDGPCPMIVGKGITFDTGGISIKPAGGMEDMKWDMGGAGVVSGVMHALAARKAEVNAVGIVGLVENMPSGKAQRPGDVVKTMSGQTIEVINTDAEGRLVLADALWWCQKNFNPHTVIDLATLTGAIIISLGHHYAGMFTNDNTLGNKLIAAGEVTGEGVWRMPLGKPYDKQVRSQIADMKNVGGRDAGSITAAQILQRFIHKNVKWAHLDIAGVTWSNSDSEIVPKGGTGFGVRLLNRLIADNYERK